MRATTTSATPAQLHDELAAARTEANEAVAAAHRVTGAAARLERVVTLQRGDGDDEDDDDEEEEDEYDDDEFEEYIGGRRLFKSAGAAVEAARGAAAAAGEAKPPAPLAAASSAASEAKQQAAGVGALSRSPRSDAKLDLVRKKAFASCVWFSRSRASVITI